MIGVIEILAWAVGVASLPLLLLRRKHVPHAAWVVLIILCAITTFWHTSNVLEWLQITTALDVYEDYIELLLPFVWGSFLYVWFQHTVTQDIARSAQLLDTERRFISTVMRATPTGIVTCDIHGNITFANPYSEWILGLSQSEMRNLTYQSPEWRIADQDGNPLPEANLPFSRILSTGEPVFGVRHRIGVGSQDFGEEGRLLSINGVPVRASDGNITTVVLTISDITEEMRSQRRIARLNALLRAVRSVNQLVSREKDVNRLLAGACTNLTSMHGYQAAYIFMPDTDGNLNPHVSSRASVPVALAENSELQRVWQTGEFAWIALSHPEPTGADTELEQRHVGIARIEHAQRTFGLLTVEVPKGLLLTEDESTLLQEVAADIGFALYGLSQEQALHEALNAKTDLLERLRALVLTGTALSLVTSTDDLCRRAVELGIASLGFDRLGIWFRTEDPTMINGSYGTDEQGHVRDEREMRVVWESDLRQQVESGQRSPLLTESAVLRDHHSQSVGTGTHIAAAIWDGEQYLGHMSADNLLSQRPLGEQDAEVLTLYATTFGHLYGRLTTERAARERDAIYRTIFQNTGTAMAIFEADGTLSLVNDETARLSGYAREEIENKLHVTDFLVDVDSNSINTYAAWGSHRNIAEGRLTAEIQVHNRHGDSRSALFAAARIPGTERTVVSLIDITPQKEAATEHRRRAVQQTALNTIIAASTQTLDVEHLMATTLDEILTALGLERGIIWLSDLKLARGLPDAAIPPDHGEAWPENMVGNPLILERTDPLQVSSDLTATLHRMIPAIADLNIQALLAVPVYLDPDHTTGTLIGKIALFSDEPRRWSDEEVALVSAVGQQFSGAAERLRLLGQVQAQAEQLQHVIDTVPESVILMDQTRHVILANLIARSLPRTVINTDSGALITRIGDRDLDDVLAPPPRGSWHRAQAVGRNFEVIARPVVPHAEPEGWVLVLRDVTEAREIEEYRQQQDRLAAVGRLAAGIAHDFNNMMAVIMLYAQMGSRVHDMPAAGLQHFETIVQQAHRASTLIQQILDFSRRSAMECRPMSLLIFLKEICRLLERTLPETITIRFDYEPGNFRVNADPTRMQQVLMNLAINARDAMPKGGELKLNLDMIKVGDDEPPVPDMGAGDWVRLRVSDSGSGIPPQIQSRLFEPFFTTKEPGLGTGLGLAQVHGILMQHGGAIHVESEAGHGTIFTLYLPSLADPRDSEPDFHPEDMSHLPMGSKQFVLVVEDNTPAREAIVEALNSLNYTVIEACDGREGLAVLAANTNDVALVLSDAVMPGMGGVQLLDAITEAGLTVPFIMMSGHFDPGERRRLQDHKNLVAWLPKPVPIERLAEVVASAVGNESAMLAASDEDGRN